MPRRGATRSDHGGGGQSTLSTTATSGNSDSDALALAHSTATISSSNAQTDAADAAASAQSTGIAQETLTVASTGGAASAPADSVKVTGRGNGKEKKPPLTHFLCIPLVTDASRPQLEASMARFRREVLGKEQERGGERRGAHDHTKATTTHAEHATQNTIEGDAAAKDGRTAEKSTDGDTLRSNGEYPAQTPGNGDNTTHSTAATAAAPFSPSAVRPVGTLHLTLGVMSLRDDSSIARAYELLRSLNLSSLLRHSKSQSPNQPQLDLSSGAAPSEKEDASSEPPLTLSLRGLHPMQSPTRTSILYAAPLDPTARLHAFASAVRDAFAPLLVPDDRPLRLHATVVNTIYAKERRGRASGGGAAGGRAAAGQKRNRDSGKFDAREVMERFDGFVWAQGVCVEGVAVCEMGARELGEGRGVGYREVAGVGFD